MSQFTELATNIRQSLRDQGLMPAYTDEGKGVHHQPPILQAMLEKALEDHLGEGGNIHV